MRRARRRERTTASSNALMLMAAPVPRPAWLAAMPVGKATVATTRMRTYSSTTAVGVLEDDRHDGADVGAHLVHGRGPQPDLSRCVGKCAVHGGELQPPRTTEVTNAVTWTLSIVTGTPVTRVMLLTDGWRSRFLIS